MEPERLEYIEKVNWRLFKDSVSRRRFMEGLLIAGGGATGLAAVSGGVTAFAEDTGTIVNTAATAEALAVTYLGAALQGAFANASGTDATVAAILTAARATEQDHYQYLVNAGAKPLTTTFTVPSSANPADKTSVLQTLVAAEGLFVNAYLAAVTSFAAAGNYQLAQVAASILGTEAEHRTLARAALVLAGNNSFAPPNNVAFEQAPLPSVSAVGQKLKDLGFIGGSGTQASYPGPGSINAAGVGGTSPPTLSPSGGAGMPSTGAHPATAGGLGSGGLAAVVLGGGAGAALAGLLRNRWQIVRSENSK
jgi:hypothetical protein